MTASPRVTTVVMTRDRWPDLSRSLARHSGPVIVVDNGSTDGSPDLVREHFPDATVLDLERNHGAVARNLGVRAADTAYVAFADDDSWWAPGALERAADLFDQHPRMAVLAARVLVGPEELLDPTSQVMAQSPLPARVPLPGPAVLGFLACGAVVRRSAFLAAGGFDEVVFFGGEEERLAVDLAAGGWGLAYVDQVVAHHHPAARRPPSTAARARWARNAVLTAVLRRPWPVVLGTVARMAAAGPAERTGVRQALAALPRALTARQPLPAQVEEDRRLLDRPTGKTAPAR